MPRLPVKKLRKQLKLLLLLALLTFAVWFTYLHISLVRQGRALRLPFAYGRGNGGSTGGPAPNPITPRREASVGFGVSPQRWWVPPSTPGFLSIPPPPPAPLCHSTVGGGAPPRASPIIRGGGSSPRIPPQTRGGGSPPSAPLPHHPRGWEPPPCPPQSRGGGSPPFHRRLSPLHRPGGSGESGTPPWDWGDQREPRRDPKPGGGFPFSPPPHQPGAALSSFFHPPLWLR